MSLLATAIPEAEMAELGVGIHTELTGSSQPHRLLKVIRALSTWKRGISERREPWLSCLHPTVAPKPEEGVVPKSWRPLGCPLTNLDREARREA